MEAILETEQVWEQEATELKEKAEKPVGFIAGIFGCWHRSLGRPFTRDNTSYRVCTNCGARRHFNAQTLETYGGYYFAPEVKPKNYADRN